MLEVLDWVLRLQNIVNLHDGEITVSSDKYQTVFEVQLPIIQSA